MVCVPSAFDVLGWMWFDCICFQDFVMSLSIVDGQIVFTLSVCVCRNDNHQETRPRSVARRSRSHLKVKKVVSHYVCHTRLIFSVSCRIVGASVSYGHNSSNIYFSYFLAHLSMKCSW